MVSGKRANLSTVAGCLPDSPKKGTKVARFYRWIKIDTCILQFGSPEETRADVL